MPSKVGTTIKRPSRAPSRRSPPHNCSDGFCLVCARRETSPNISSLGALHLHRTLGERAAELTPLLRWEADDPPHTAAEIVQGLELTWQFITACLMRGSPTDAVHEEEVPIVQTIWGLLDHDLPHAGELSLLLGASGLPGVEI